MTESGAAVVQAEPQAEPVRKRARGWRIARNLLLGLLAAIFACWLVLFVTKGRFLKHPFERTVSTFTDRKVSVNGDFQLYFAPLRIKFYAEGLSISNPAWASRPNLFTAERIDARIAPLSLLFGKKHIHSLDLSRGALDLEWNAAGNRNSWTFGEATGQPLTLPRIDRATLVGTTVHYVDPRLRLLADLGIGTVTARDTRIGEEVGVRGTGRIRDTPFRLVARLMTPDATIASGENKLSLRLWAANNVIDVAGTLPSLAEFEEVPLRTRARGRNLSELLGIIGVALPRTRTYVVNAQLVKSGETYRFTKLGGRFGNSDLAGTLTVTNGERLRLDLVLTTRRLDIVDAAPFIGYNPDIVATSGAIAAAAATGAAPRRVLPDAALPVAALQRFDAGLKWRIGEVSSRNVPISNIDLTLALDRGRLALSPLAFTMARGKVTSDMIFDTRRRPAAVSYDIRLALHADGEAAGRIWRCRRGNHGDDPGPDQAGRARRHDPRFARHRLGPHRLRDTAGDLLDPQRAAVGTRRRHLRPEDVRRPAEGAGGDQLRGDRLSRSATASRRQTRSSSIRART